MNTYFNYPEDIGGLQYPVCWDMHVLDLTLCRSKFKVRGHFVRWRCTVVDDSYFLEHELRHNWFWMTLYIEAQGQARDVILS